MDAIRPDGNTVLLDDFNGAAKGTGFGTLTYGESLPNLEQAVNLTKGAYIKYAFSPWYRWDGVHKWDRNEAAPGVLTEGTIEMWIKPRQYSIVILEFNWSDLTSLPQAGTILAFELNADGKLAYNVWGGNQGKMPVGKTTIPLNKWTHVAVSWSPNGTKLYVNGLVDAYVDANVWPAFSGTVFAYLSHWGRTDIGFVDEFHISKVARTDEEIRFHAVVSISGKATIIVSTYTDNAVVKLDSNGNILWATNVGGNVFQAVENPTDKTIYAVGGGIFTKLSSDGAILLQKSISGNTIDVDPIDGSFYVGAYADWVSISKYDANGNFIKSFGGSIGGPDPAVYRADGSIYANSYSAGVYKFDKDGNLLWQKEPVEWHNAYGFATIVVDQRDGSVVASAQWGEWQGSHGEGYVVRFDADGNTIWAKSIQPARMRTLTYSRNAIDPIENVVYGADESSGNLYKINLTNGDVIWSKSIGDSPTTPSVDPFDESIYVGKTYVKEIVKVDKNSNILWGPKYIGYYIWYLETTSDTGAGKIVENLPIRDIEGVGDSYAERLEKQGVKKIKDMALANVFSLYKKVGIPLFKLYVIKRRATLALDIKIEKALFGSILQMPLGEIISMPDEELSRKANQPIEVISGLKRDISTLLISLDNSTVKAMTLERLT